MSKEHLKLSKKEIKNIIQKEYNTNYFSPIEHRLTGEHIEIIIKVLVKYSIKFNKIYTGIDELYKDNIFSCRIIDIVDEINEGELSSDKDDYVEIEEYENLQKELSQKTS